MNNNDCCGPNVPESLNCCAPSYGAGIVNTPFGAQNNNDCCNCNGGAYSVPGTVGYGQIGTIQQNQSIDQWCCGPSNYVAPAFTQPQIIPQQIATQLNSAQVIQTTSVGNAPLIISTIGTESLVREPIVNPIVNSII